MMAQIAHDMERNIKNSFKQLAEDIPELDKVEYEYTMAHGSTTDVIASSLMGLDIDMIVMGTHGVSGVNEILLGSNTYSVIKSVNIPVLVIPVETGVYNFNKIALTSDYKNIDNLNIFDPLIRFANSLHAEVDIIHFSASEVLNEEEISMGKSIESYFKKIRHSYHAAGVTDDFEKAIHEYIIQHNIDLLVMVPRKHNIFDRLFGDASWTRRMVFHTKTPLLILPA
jgi:nucleotide-binding universal stress UspA family protein